MLFMSTEGLWDMAKEAHPHSDIYAHQIDEHQHQFDGEDPLADDCEDQCSNYCHGHFSALLAIDIRITSNAEPRYQILTSAPYSAQPQAPPTPPPNV